MKIVVYGNSGSGKSTYAQALATRQAWVAEYYTRDDAWSYSAHRRIFDAHLGAKQEHTSAPPIGGTD
ncbi:MAG: hypothetical protein SFU84_00380 [Gemmatimonadales bacterium]|nr:hypothetical protein [Gemmatimonadales bacterium]